MPCIDHVETIFGIALLPGGQELWIVITESLLWKAYNYSMFNLWVMTWLCLDHIRTIFGITFNPEQLEL